MNNTDKNRYFHLRLNSTYQEKENKVDDLLVEVLTDDGWETLNLDIRSPGFLLFINGLFSCQHLYMRTNCAERDLVLASSTGELNVVTDVNWHITSADVSFRPVLLKSGEPAQEALDYIVERMHHCPVSSNLPDKLRLNIDLQF